MKLTSDTVTALVGRCLADADTARHQGTVVVRGLANSYAFDHAAVADSAGQIAELLGQLPKEFQPGGEGGSFLQAVTDRDGERWTDLHSDAEALMCLGIAAGKGRFASPRERWPTLPGGVPLFSVSQGR